ncbi:MAG TPA: tetratricopeptide repeat protein, partial [Candidatus Melainabacteria bacterium]|nr:tetratricopeptide repeat protein [Candidatus Melainabacteria bacterium]
IYDKIGEPEKARYDYLDYLESSNLKPEHGIFDPKVLLKFGKLFDRVGQTEKKNELYSDAIERFTAKLKVSPKDARLYSYRAQIYAAQNNLKTAAKDFETAGKLKHSNAETIAWAEFALINKQYELASKLALELIEADVTNELIFQASVFEALGAHKEALRLASDALKQDPFLPAAYYWIGKARAGLGEKEEAARKLQQATALGYDPEASLFEDQNEDDDDDE